MKREPKKTKPCSLKKKNPIEKTTFEKAEERIVEERYSRTWPVRIRTVFPDGPAGNYSGL